MKNLIFCMALALVLAGCGDKKEPPVVAAPPKQPTADLAAGKVIAERDCKACHGLDGGGVAPGIPRLAGQRERYLAASLNEYKEGKRSHAALRNMTANMSEADLRNVASYFASLPPVATAGAVEVKHSSPYEQGKTLAAACVKCHGADGNSQIPGTPTLAGQQPHYLVAAIQEYHQGDRAKGAMKSGVRNTDKLELESVALYFAAQTPV